MLSSLLAKLSNISVIFQRGCFCKIIILPHCSADSLCSLCCIAVEENHKEKKLHFIALRLQYTFYTDGDCLIFCSFWFQSGRKMKTRSLLRMQGCIPKERNSMRVNKYEVYHHYGQMSSKQSRNIK